MKPHKLSTLILGFLLLLGSLEIQARPLVWMAVKLPSDMATNMDIEDFITVTRLDDQARIAMFQEAGKDFSKYQALKRRWAQKRFESGIRQWTYFKILEKDATKGSNPAEWKAFKVTEREFREETDKIEDRAVGELLKSGKGIRWAWDQFGANLKKKGWPHKKGISNTDLYFEWFNLQKQRLTEQLRIREVQRYESVMARKQNPDLYIRPVDIFDFGKDAERKIKDLLSEKSIGEQEANDIISKNPELRVLIKDLKFVSSSSMSLAELNQRSPELFKAFQLKIEDKVLPRLNSERIAKIMSYERIAQKLAKKYPSAEKLKELSEKMRMDFVNGKVDFNGLMLSRLYNMAATLHEETVDTTKTQKIIGPIVTSMVDTLKESLKDEDYLLDDTRKGVRIEDRVARDLHNLGTEKLNGNKDKYTHQLLGVAVWSLKFEVKRVGLQEKPVVQVNLFEKGTYERQQRIERHLQMQEYEKGLKSYRQRDLRWYWEGLFSLNINGEIETRGRAAYDFILQK